MQKRTWQIKIFFRFSMKIFRCKNNQLLNFSLEMEKNIFLGFYYLGPKAHFKNFFSYMFWNVCINLHGNMVDRWKGWWVPWGKSGTRVKGSWGKSGHHFLIIVELSKFADMFIINKLTSLTTLKKKLIFKNWDFGGTNLDKNPISGRKTVEI